MAADQKSGKNKFSPYISPGGAWALALGTSIGWGSLVVTSNTYLSQAGPLGSILGLAAGALIMIIISRNYHYMINCFPEAGGVYTYTKDTFGYDHGFLTAWFLALTYLAMLWANATALPLFVRYFIGNIFRFGRLYSFFGYDVYFGEVLLTLAGILIAAFLCRQHRRITIRLMTVMAILICLGITVCFAGVIFARSGLSSAFEPAYIPDKNELSQIILIACISPWAFIGFENISHSAEEFAFPRSRVFRILTVSVLSAAVLYIFVLILSVSTYPPDYGSWLEYIRDLNSLTEIKGLPVFYAADHFLGSFGVNTLIVCLLALILTSLIGNITAMSRLLYALAGDEILPSRFAELNEKKIPAGAIALIALLSLPVPFLGRTTIGWIMDVTTIGATIIYGFVCASTLKTAKKRKDTHEIWTGRAGLLIMIVFGAYLLLPNLFSAGSMEKESYFIFAVWGILGFIFFRNILSRDRAKHFGKSVIVWIALLSLILFIALIWMSQSVMSSTRQAMANIQEHYQETEEDEENYISLQMNELQRSNTQTMLMVTGLFTVSLIVLMTNYAYIIRRAKESEESLEAAQTLANTDPLTGVKSKHAFIVREEAMNAAIASGAAEEFSIVVCDVNGLKFINDTYGHKAGDEYIRAVSRLICDLFQHSPVFRIGGDEFVVIMSGRDHENRHGLLASLRQHSRQAISTDEVVVSAGLSDFHRGEDPDVHTVFERADQLMYQEKQQLKTLGAKTR